MTEEVRKQLADWIDTDAIAGVILEELEDEEVEPTLNNAQQVWLAVLYQELSHGVRGSVKALADKGDFDGEEQLPESICEDGSIAK